jgi:alpha,alpha-trehalase
MDSGAKEFKVQKQVHEAVIFDLDGVITDTASVHARAWKHMFDDFLSSHADRTGEEQPPFDEEEDYLRYVDGRPRYEGVSTFLESRGIDIPYGSTEDPAGINTICGLGNRKNGLFLEHLKKEGVKTYASSIELIKRLSESNMKTAIVTSSRNGRSIMEKAGITDYFDVQVDGKDAGALSLKGKPAPDIFLEAAKRLKVSPQRAVLIEDSTAGVAAGRAGNFGWVIGVDRFGRAEDLERSGADMVVTDLNQIRPPDTESATDENRSLPSALDAFDNIFGDPDLLCHVVLFLDYDGTLTPIVNNPEDAGLSENMSAVLQELAQACPVAVVSGRDLSDIRKRVAVEDIYYAGSHGFEIIDPEDQPLENRKFADFLPKMDRAEDSLYQRIKDVSGARVERKKYSIAVHYRQAANSDIPAIEDAVKRVCEDLDGLRMSRGKKIFEVHPDVDWHKGKAVRSILSSLHRDPETVLPVYIGDDVTDEDAFRALKEKGVGICVTEDGTQKTAASYRLNHPDEVYEFLNRLSRRLQKECLKTEWILAYDGFDAKEEGLREALCTLGNGFFCTRGAAPEAHADDVHYPGTYLAGGYNRLQSEKAGKFIENEDLVNLPNWLSLTFRIDSEKWFALDDAAILDYRQALDIRKGILFRNIRVRDPNGRVSRICQRRFVHMEHAHLAGLEMTIIPENWTGKVEFLSALDGRITNKGVERYLGLNNHHLRALESACPDQDLALLKVQTSQSELRIAMASRLRLLRQQKPVQGLFRNLIESDHVFQIVAAEASPENAVTVEKIVSIYTSRDPAMCECGRDAVKTARHAPGFQDLLHSHAKAWRFLWKRFQMEMTYSRDVDKDRIRMVANLYTFHLLQTTSMHTMRMAMDAGVPSRGWHGEAYRGHIFWDELFIFPLINFRLPEVTRSLLMYRYRRLDRARINAREAGYEGAMYPWQSGSSGREESQKIHLNPRSNRWIPDNSRLQRHVNAAIAYNIYRYYQVTHDIEFLSFYGAEMMLEIARFWASIARYNPELERYEILGVMGPDEYHDAYPDSGQPGLNNNTYTNIMAAWVLKKACKVTDLLPEDAKEEVCHKIDFSRDELERWNAISRKMRVVFHADGIISQFEGYEALPEFDWEGYRRKYGDIQRLDRILEAESDSPNNYKASKQADVLMLFYLMSAEELSEIFHDLGYPFEHDTIPRNIKYYLNRTSHGSTLSRVVHGWLMARGDRTGSWDMFLSALQSDVADIQGGTTPEGIHLGAMAGTLDQLQRGYSGLDIREDVLWINPCLPRELDRMCIKIRFRGHFLKIDISQRQLSIKTLHAAEKPFNIGIRDQIHVLHPDSEIRFQLSARCSQEKE